MRPPQMQGLDTDVSHVRFNITELAESARNVFLTIATSQKATPFTGATTEARDSWSRVAILACRICSDEESMPWLLFAGKLFAAFFADSQASQPEGPFESQPQPLRVAWEAVGRHLANLCFHDPEPGENYIPFTADEVASLEAQSVRWARDRIVKSVTTNPPHHAQGV